MRAALKLLNPQERGLAGAKFRAWWEGEAFDAEAFAAAQAGEPAAPPEHPDLSAHLFDAPRDARLDALQKLWGEGRIGPPMSGADEALAALAPPEGAVVILLGPGLFAFAAPFLGVGSLKLMEWRSETLPALTAGAAQSETVSVEAFDLDVTTLPAETYDGLISFDEFTYAGNPTRLALQIARTLKPGAKALIETYAAGPDPDVAAAFASAYAEPQLHPHATIAHALTEAGLDLELDEDVTADHVKAARAAFHAFSEKAAEMGALSPREAQELSWETQTWRTRLTLLIHGRLQRRKFVARRRV